MEHVWFVRTSCMGSDSRLLENDGSIHTTCNCSDILEAPLQVSKACLLLLELIEEKLYYVLTLHQSKEKEINEGHWKRYKTLPTHPQAQNMTELGQYDMLKTYRKRLL